MVLRKNPSGPERLRTSRVLHDWGTVPPGKSEVIIPAAVSPGTTRFATVTGSVVAPSIALAAWGATGIYSEYTNNTVDPLDVGVLSYEVLEISGNKVRGGPSGPNAIVTVTVVHDWGLLPPGQSEAVIPFTPPPGYACFATLRSQIPADVFGLGLWSGNGIYAQFFNGTASDVAVGIVQYEVILVSKRRGVSPQAPSGADLLKVIPMQFDWGTVPVGDSVNFQALALSPAEFAIAGTQSPEVLPPEIKILCVWGAQGGNNGILSIVHNEGAVPYDLGIVTCAVAIFKKRGTA